MTLRGRGFVDGATTIAFGDVKLADPSLGTGLSVFSGSLGGVFVETDRWSLYREMIAVVVSSINRCCYCQVAHGATVRALGSPELGEAMVMNWRYADLDARQTAMLTFAEKCTKARAEIVESDRQALRDAGFSDRDIFDIASTTAFYNMSNRVASAIGMQPNPEYHAQAR